MQITGFTKDISFLFEAPIQQLLGWKSPLLQEKGFAFYYRVLIYYFTGNKTDLELLIQETKNDPLVNDIDSRAALVLAEIRLNLLMKGELLRFANHELKHLEIHNEFQLWPEYWQSEYWALQARIYDLLEKNELASELYEKASLAYRRVNCLRKELRCHFNSLICKDRLNLGISYHYEYFNVAQRARKLKEFNAMIMSYLALSQKLGDMGAFRLALKYVNKAIKRGKQEAGSNDYFKALLQRAFIYFLNNNFNKANSDLNEARLCYSVEIKSTLEFLDLKFNQKKPVSMPPSRLLFAGIYERSNQFYQSVSPLSFLEEKLVSILLMKPRTKLELLSRLWDTTIDLHDREMRFKSLLKSIRKKAPESIIFKNNYYKLESLEVRVKYV